MLRNHCCILARTDSVIYVFFWADFHQLSNSNFVSKCWVWLQSGYCYFKWQHTWAGKQSLNKPKTDFKWDQNSAGMHYPLLRSQWMTPTNPNHSSAWGLLLIILQRMLKGFSSLFHRSRCSTHGQEIPFSPFVCFRVVWSFMNSFMTVRLFPSTSAVWEPVCTLVYDQAGTLYNSSPDHNAADLGCSIFAETALATWYFGKLVFWVEKGKVKDP